MYLLAEALPFIRRWRLLRQMPVNRDQVVLLMAALNEILLGVDTYLAHSISGTIRPGEWIPIIFGPVSGVLLLFAGLIALRRRQAANIIASLVFLASMAVGVLGSYYHLYRAVLISAPAGQQLTALILVYAPPLLGPLTFALVGLLGISAAWEEAPVDSGILRLFGGLRVQMPLPKTRAYFLLVALFILATVLSSVLDHARTNFTNYWLWLPTAVGAFATFVTLAMGAYSRVDRSDLLTFLATMGLMILVGLVGAVLHIERDLTGQGALLVERAIHGAPLMAPLLFANMGALGLIVLLDPAPGREGK
jgi:MprA protease rhombosortase-interaction domain-containing protein